MYYKIVVAKKRNIEKRDTHPLLSTRELNSYEQRIINGNNPFQEVPHELLPKGEWLSSELKAGDSVTYEITTTKWITVTAQENNDL